MPGALPAWLAIKSVTLDVVSSECAPRKHVDCILNLPPLTKSSCNIRMPPLCVLPSATKQTENFWNTIMIALSI